MCGRFTLTVPTAADLVAGLGLGELGDAAALEAAHRPRYNVAPRQRAWIVRMRSGMAELVQAEWGLVPRWSKTLDHAGRPINARAETIEDKPSFRVPIARQRCLVVSDGFYEWQSSPEGKRPLWFRPSGGGLLRMGGVFDTWIEVESASRRLSFAVVTTEAGPDVADVHDRMPVVIGERDVETWLTTPPLEAPAPVTDEVRALMRPLPSGALVRSFVSRRVGSVRNDDASVLVDDDAAEGTAPRGTTSTPAARRRRRA